MVERSVVLENIELKYTGIFDVKEFYKLMDDWFQEKGYDKEVIKHLEEVTDKGKQITMLIAPYRKVSDYLRYVMKIWVYLFDVTEIEVKKDNTKVKLNKGRIMLSFDAFLDTDYENRWEQKPLYVFLRSLFDKFIHRQEIEKYEVQLAEEVDTLMTEVKSFLNLYRYGVSIRARKPSEHPGYRY